MKDNDEKEIVKGDGRGSIINRRKRRVEKRIE